MNDRPRLLKKLGMTILLMLGYLFVVDPWLGEHPLKDYQYAPEARAYSQTIQELSATQLAQQINAARKPTVLVMYASWCPYCHKQLPITEALAKAYGTRVNWLIISIDKNKSQLADYLLKHHQPLTFTPYHMDAREYEGYQSFFAQFGGNFKGGIPYLGVFDASGTMRLEIPGLVNEPDLRQALDVILKDSSNI